MLQQIRVDEVRCVRAFLDVVQSPKSSTPYLVAFDALRILPHFNTGSLPSYGVNFIIAIL